MTFEAEAQKSASERFFLVKLKGRVGLEPVFTATPNVYKAYILPKSIDFLIEEIYVNGALIPSNKWSLGEDEYGKFILIESATNLADLDNVTYFEHGIYMTGGVVRYTTLVDSGIATASWLPKIKNYPQFSQSMRDIAEGVFSLSNTSIDVISTDTFLQLSADSYANAPVTVWACIDSPNTNRRIFDGVVSSISYQYGVCTFNLIDTFNTLKDSAEFGDRKEAYNYKTNTRTPYISQADENSTATLVVGRTSPLIVSNGGRQSGNYGDFYKFFHLSDGLRAIPLTENFEQATSVQFYLGRMIGNQLKKLTFGNIIRSYRLYTNGGYADYDKNYTTQAVDYHPIILMYLDNFNGEIGDYIPNLTITGSGAATYKAFCCHNQLFTFEGNLYNCAFAPVVYSYNTNDYRISGSVSVTLPAANTVPSISLFSEGNGDIQYKYDRVDKPNPASAATLAMKYSGRYLPFTVSIANSYTYGGEIVSHVYATVSSADIGGDLPGSLSVKGRFSPLEEVSHSKFMKFICKAGGLTTNDLTFTAADAVFGGKVCLTVPTFGETAYPSYLEIAQKVTSSVLSLLRINNAREIEYYVMKALDGFFAPKKNPVNMLQGSTSSTIDFQDLATSVIFTNLNFKEAHKKDTALYNATVDFPRLKYFLRTEKTKNVDHVLDDMSSRKDFVARYFSTSNVEYTLATSSEDLASKIGDIIEIQNNNALMTFPGYAMITSLDQTGSKTNVKANGNVGV